MGEMFDRIINERTSPNAGEGLSFMLNVATNPFRVAANTMLGGIHNIGAAITGSGNYVIPNGLDFLNPYEQPFQTESGDGSGYTEAVRRNFGGGTGTLGVIGERKSSDWWNKLYSGEANQDYRWNFGITETPFREGGYAEAQRGADEFAEQTIADPLMWIGIGSGINAVSKGKKLIKQAQVLLDAGVDKRIAAGFIEKQAGPKASTLEQILGVETPHDYFTSGRVFNKNPILDVFGKGRSDLVHSTATTQNVIVDAEKGPALAKEAPSIDEILAPRAIVPTETRTVWQALPDEQILEEALTMAKKRGLYGELAEEIAQDAVARTWTSVGTMPVRGGGNAAGKLRQTLRGHIQHAIRDAKAHPAGITNIPSEASPALRQLDESYMFSLKRTAPATETDVRKAIEGFGEVDRVNDMDEGSLLVTMKNGKQIVAEIGQEIASPEAGKVVGGRFFLDQNGVFRAQFTKHTDVTDVFEEFTHALIRTGLLEEEMPRLTKKFADGIENAVDAEELIVKGLKQARFSEDSISRKIWELLVSLYENVTGRKTATGDIRRIVQGEPWDRPMKSDPFGIVNSSANNIQKNTIRYSVKQDDNSALSRATRTGHIRGIFEQAKQESIVDKLRSQEWRNEVWTSVAEKGWDELYRVRKTMIRQAGGSVVTNGQASAHILLQNLSGLLSHTKTVVEKGIRHGKDWLWKGNMVDSIHNPIMEFLKKRGIDVTSGNIDQVFREADAYLVSRRAVSLHDQALSAADELAASIHGGSGAPQSNPLLFRKIVSGNDLEKAAGMSAEEAKQFLRSKADDWSKRNIGLANATGGESDITEARAILKEIEADPDKLAAFDKIRETVSGVNRATVEYAYRKGMITQPELDYMLSMSDDYAPLSRVMEETINSTPAGSGSDLVKTLKGSEREILNPVTATMEKAVNWMRRSDINEVFARWLSDADADYLADLGVTRVGSGEEGNIKTILVNGERTFWKFENEDLFKSIERIGRAEPQDSFSKVMSFYKRVVREFVTHSPGFPVRNFIHDSFMRAITSEHETGVFAGLQKTTADELADLIWAGGDQAGYYGRVADEYAKQLKINIRKVAKDPKTILMRVEDAGSLINGVWDKWGDFLAKGEMQNRLAEFRAAREDIRKLYPNLAEYEVDRIAAYKARDLMDFALIGEWGRKINNFVPFFNPAVQGTAKILRTARNNPTLFTKRLMLYVGMPSVGCYLYNVSVGADKEYRNLPAYRRDLYWNFKVGDRWLVIPKPFEAGVLGTSFERAIDYGVSGDKMAFAGLLPSAERGDIGTLIKSASPVDEALLAGPFRPVLEILANRDLFRDQYIIPPYEEGLDPKLRKQSENASEIGKILSKMTGQIGVLDDPRQWDYLMRGLFSEYGRMATDFTSDRAGQTLAKNLTGGFTRKTSAWSLQSVQDTLRMQERKGVNRRKEAKEYRGIIKKTQENPTSVNINDLLRKSEQEQKRVKRISIDEILSKRKY